jgi:hypothetical protein
VGPCADSGSGMTLLSHGMQFGAEAGEFIFVLLADFTMLCLEIVERLMYFLKLVDLGCNCVAER